MRRQLEPLFSPPPSSLTPSADTAPFRGWLVRVLRAIADALERLRYTLEVVSEDLEDHVAAADPHPLYQLRAEEGVASGYATLDASTLVVQNPANATATPTASKIPIADGSNKLAIGWFPLGSAVADASGGVVIDAECRAAVNALLAQSRLGKGGNIAT